MGRLGLVVAGAALVWALDLTPAFAQADSAAGEAPPVTEPVAAPVAAPVTAPAEPTEEMIVVGQREVARKRAAIERDLQEMGYKPIDRGDYTVYRPASVWHPSVLVYDDGFVVIKRTPPRFEPPIAGSSNMRYLACLPPFTPMCVRLGGWMVSDKKLTAQKARVANALDPEVDAWQAAIVRYASAVRVGQEVPNLLTASWEEGAPLEAGGPTLPDPADRRAAILEFWATRADTPEGAAVRQVTGDFIQYVIQDSPFPATAEEIQAAEARCGCGASVLDDAAPSPADATQAP